jgi:hypothetical protein
MSGSSILSSSFPFVQGLACKKAHEIVYGGGLLDACDHFECYDCSWIFS